MTVGLKGLKEAEAQAFESLRRKDGSGTGASEIAVLAGRVSHHVSDSSAVVADVYVVYRNIERIDPTDEEVRESLY